MAGGRPTKYNDGVIEQTRELALGGKTDEEIASELDVSRSTLALWKARHPEFSDALRAWKNQADDQVEHTLYRKALAGDTTACIFWLKNRRSQEWRDKREVEHSGELNVDGAELLQRVRDEVRDIFGDRAAVSAYDGGGGLPH